MTQKFGRRVLTFHAIHPCEGVSPTTLLRAAIDVCRIISSYRSKSFPSHGRIAREAIREIEILLFFFEEIHDRRSTLSHSAVLCLSELYASLQKIRFLLEDCTHEGARIWILAHSEQVADEFRHSIRSIATALDLLPLASLDVSLEVMEIVELLAKQARKAKIGIDPDDRQAAADVLVILSQFRRNIVPDSADLKRVLWHLGIRGWSECNEEIKFLEKEMAWEDSKGHELEFKLLSGLAGLMIYCRGVLFDVVDSRKIEKLDLKLDSKGLNCLNPEDFRCPISLELMKDPVIVATGQTYDRASIQKWLKSGNLTCPKTGEKLKNSDFIPNLALRSLIQQFLEDSGVAVSELSIEGRESAKTQISRSSAVATEAIRMLAIFLVEKLSTGTAAEKNKAAYEIRLLTKSNVSNRACFVEAGAVMSLLNLLSFEIPTLQDNAMAALLNLSKHSKGKTIIFESGGLGPVLGVLKQGLRNEIRQNAAATLFYLASIGEYCEAIGENPGSIPALVELLGAGTDRGKKNAVAALFALLRFPGNHQRAIAAGVIPALMNLLSSDRDDVVNDSLAVLATLAEHAEGSKEVLAEIAIPSLVKVLLSATSRAGKEHCISILLSLCVNGGEEVVSDMKKMPSLVRSLCLLLTEGTSRPNKKANMLLRILHDCPRRNSPGMLVSSARQRNVVRAQ